MLSLLLACPLAGMLLVLASPRTAVRAIRAIAVSATGAAFVVSLKLLFAFRAAEPGLQFVERVPWIQPLNVFYFLGVDGISLPMVLLTTLLGFLACLASFSIPERHKEYFALYLLLEAGMLGTFLALDLFLFYLFF